jgi:hypothetical protein
VGNVWRKLALKGALLCAMLAFLFASHAPHSLCPKAAKQKDIEELAHKRKEMFERRKAEKKGPLTKQERKGIEHPDEEIVGRWA